MPETLTEQSAELKEKILRMAVEQENTTIREARDALRTAIIEYDSMSREMTAKMPVKRIAEVFDKRKDEKE